MRSTRIFLVNKAFLVTVLLLVIFLVILLLYHNFTMVYHSGCQWSFHLNMMKMNKIVVQIAFGGWLGPKPTVASLFFVTITLIVLIIGMLVTIVDHYEGSLVFLTLLICLVIISAFSFDYHLESEFLRLILELMVLSLFAIYNEMLYIDRNDRLRSRLVNYNTSVINSYCYNDYSDSRYA